MDFIRFISTPRFNGRTISYTAIIRYYYEDGAKVKFDTDRLEFNGEGFIFANEFLAVMNKTFGTDYEFSESYKDEVGKKHGNIDMHKDFALRKSWGNKWELLHHYDYDNVKGCTATYGEYTKEVLIAFADAVADYNKNGLKPRATEFHPDYKIDREEEIAKAYIDKMASLDAEVKKATDALALTLSGAELDKAVSAVKSGYYWSYSRCREEKWDAEQNLHLDEMENVIKSVKTHIKRYKDYFDIEVENTKREHYYSGDDRYHTWVGLRCDEKNGESFFNITPCENDGELTFSFVGEVNVGIWQKKPYKVSFNMYGLTLEEIERVNHDFNELWYKAKFEKEYTYSISK